VATEHEQPTASPHALELRISGGLEGLLNVMPYFSLFLFFFFTLSNSSTLYQIRIFHPCSPFS
jgi:hypothetical protein